MSTERSLSQLFNELIEFHSTLVTDKHNLNFSKII